LWKGLEIILQHRELIIMNQAVFRFELPSHEPVLSYAPGTPERISIKEELERQSKQEIEIPLIIGGKEIRTGDTGNVVMPHNHGHCLATYHKTGPKEVLLAVEAALEARKLWMNLSWIERSSIMLKAAKLISGKYRHVLNAATMLGQGKNVYQAEIDSACESIDFLRFNVHFASRIFEAQPMHGADSINRLEYRPLEGFVFAVTPFNFTSIAMNLNTSVALMGNTTLWKPATTALLSGYYIMQILEEAGMPGGVVNFVPGPSGSFAKIVMEHPELAGIHFTGSTKTFETLWKNVSSNMDLYNSYPRMVGETGGKDFVFAHPSADPKELVTALVRGAFEYQGQKCSAASRVYMPRSLWQKTRDMLVSWTEELNMGDVKDFRNFVNAVIDKPAFDKIMGYIDMARNSPDADILCGGKGDDSHGYFIRPTLIEVRDPHFATMKEEIFGPVLSIFVYEDDAYLETLELCNRTSPYALTGAVFGRDRYALMEACRRLRYAAGNFYINDKPTGAVVGQQPFGGSRRSGTNDKAGSQINLLRWVSPRTIKENLLPPRHYKYPFMEEE